MEYRFTHNVNQPAPLADFIPNTLDQNLYSAFVQDQITLFDDVYLTLGSKLEHNDYTGFEWEPSARLQWNISDNQMLWGAISRAVRMPSEYDRNLYTPSPDYLLFLANSNSTFASETLIAYEAGYRAQFNNRVSGSLSAFFNDYDHLRSLDYTPGGAGGFLPLYWANDDDGETWGFELNVNYQPLPWWRLNLGYDFLQENIFTKSGTVDLDARVEDTADPENQIFIRSTMDLPHHIEFGADGRWIDRAEFDNGAEVGTVPSYFELDLSLGWRPAKNIEVSVTGQNLVHDQHVEAGYPYNVPQTQEAIVRNVYGQVTWQF
ncbi:MAG: TonB-dependent receptor plug domain-containing protein [Limisphaerales bacterium]